MEKIDWIFLATLLISILVLLVYLYFLLTDLSNEKLYKKASKCLDVSLKNAMLTYFKTKDYNQCVFEIDIIFKNIIFRDKMLGIQYTNVIDLLENHIHKINADTIELEGIDKDLYKRVVKELIDIYAKRNPLEQIKGADFIILNELIKCLDKSDIEEGKKVINQIAIEIKNLRDTNAENEKNNGKQAVIGKVGIIMSCIFGAMTFIQFFI